MYAPYCAEYVPVCTSTSWTASTMGRVGVVVIRLFMMLIPSSDMLFWISRVPAPLKSSPGGMPVDDDLVPWSTPGVIRASVIGSRPFNGSSAMLRLFMTSDTLPSSVLIAALLASTATAGVRQRPRKAMPKFLFISYPLKKQPSSELRSQV